MRLIKLRQQIILTHLKTAAEYYFGKRVAYIYKTHSGKAENRFRVKFDIIEDYLGTYFKKSW